MTDGATPEAIYHKVIIVGGSLAGITLALALEHTDIDFILLERGDFAPFLGTSLVISGCGMRILDQLGVAAKIIGAGVKIKYARAVNEDGKFVFQLNIGPAVEEKLGYPTIILSRTELLKVVYEEVKDKSRLLSHNGAISFSENDEGVTVTCEDGTMYKGDILVGADGIHSRVREFMFDTLADSELKDRVYKTRKDLGADFTCVFGVSENVPDLTLERGIAFQLQGVNRNFGLVTGKEGELFYFLCEKIPRVQTPNIPRFTKEDAENSMVSVLHLEVEKGITVGDIFSKSIECNKVALEEHMFEISSSKRTCIIGDALHKMTPNDGWGGVMAIESAAYLANALNKYLDRSGPTPVDTTTTMLQQFSSTRHNRVPKIITKSGISTRLHAGSEPLYRFLRSNVIPIIPGSFLVNQSVDIHAGGMCLDYLPKPKHHGTILYVDERPIKKGWFS